MSELYDKTSDLGRKVLGNTSAVGTFHEDGYWNANAANGHHCIGIYGMETEADALDALVAVLKLAELRKKKRRTDEVGGR